MRSVVTVDYVPTDLNPGDLFTKVLKRQPFERHRRAVMNCSPSEGGVEEAASYAKLRRSVSFDLPRGVTPTREARGRGRMLGRGRGRSGSTER